VHRADAVSVSIAEDSHIPGSSVPMPPHEGTPEFYAAWGTPEYDALWDEFQ
jgi:hypothetical protein